MVPAEIAQDDTLSGDHKMLFGAINSLFKASEGRCIAGNPHLAFLTGQSVSNVELGLRALKKREHFHVVTADPGRRGHISVILRPTQRLGTYPTQSLGTDEMLDKTSVAGARYYASEDVDRVRCNVSSPLSFSPTGRRNRRDIVGSREMDQALQEELVSQGKMSPGTKPPSKPSKPAVVEPDQIRHVRDIREFPWWPHKAWDEFLEHRV
jgi:hypothetical protein